MPRLGPSMRRQARSSRASRQSASWWKISARESRAESATSGSWKDLGSQAATCGLNQGTIESAVYKHLTANGLQVRRNSDEDTYVYVNINVGNLSNGLCVSRFDVYLTTHTTATLSYQNSPVLVEVTLMHKGSLAGGSPAAHADSVQKGVLEYVDQIAARIKDAN